MSDDLTTQCRDGAGIMLFGSCRQRPRACNRLGNGVRESGCLWPTATRSRQRRKGHRSRTRNHRRRCRRSVMVKTAPVAASAMAQAKSLFEFLAVALVAQAQFGDGYQFALHRVTGIYQLWFCASVRVPGAHLCGVEDHAGRPQGRPACVLHVTCRLSQTK